MGKRELFIVVGFVVLGALVYQFTAPEPVPGKEGFSWTRLLSSVRGELRGRNVRVEARRSAGLAVPPSAKMLSVKDFRGQTVIEGADRDDLAGALTADAYGLDDADAKAQGDRVRLDVRLDGDTIVVAVVAPSNGRRSRATLHLTVPRRLALDLGTTGQADVTDVAAVTLGTRSGPVTIRNVSGVIRGEHRDGDVALSDANDVSVTARRGAVRFEHVTGAITAEVVDGRLTCRDVSGTVKLETRRVEAELERTSGEVTVNATDGSLLVREPAGPVVFDGRRARLTVVAITPVALTATSSDATLDVTLPRGGLHLDLAADDGRIELPKVGVPVTGTEPRREARGDVAGGGPTWKLRTTRADIIVRQ